MEKIDEQEDPSSFIKKFILILVFFAITPIALISSVVSLVAITNSSAGAVLGESVSIIESPQPGVQVFASLPSDFPGISGEIVEKDARGELIRQFLDKYNSPIEPYAKFIVNKSDEYGLDFRLLTAIAMKESGLGKAMPNPDCNNAWGYGIHSAGTLCFDTWEEGIDYVSRGLKENYADKGYVTVEEIMTKYAHPDSTTWADGVNMYMEKIID
ncbi:glucosaminidase domain-containing protein, partial [Patescibacteria group bacterium]|nr:glucosaminidase domain-containing protein [Patescibacteria group bacterium]